MKRFTLNKKLWSIVGLLWLLLIALVVANAVIQRNSMLNARKAVLKQQADLAQGLISWYQQKTNAGELKPAQAQHMALEALRGLRYGSDKSGYFGIYNDEYVPLLFPPRPDLENKSQQGLVDVNGVHVAVEIVKSSSAGGKHFTHYVWPKPGNDKPVGKITYSELIPAWGWHLYTGVYQDDIDNAFRTELLRNLALVSSVAIVLTLAMLWLIRSIRHSLGGEPDYAAALCKRIAEGNLSAQVLLRKNDRSSLLFAMDQMQRRLTETLSDIHLAADSVGVASRQISGGNLDLSSRTEQQAASLVETAASMEQINVTVKQNAGNAREASRLATDAAAATERSNQMVSRMQETMRDIADSSGKIADITALIEGIAFQTNILALNAAVEAARAGEQGRGFAVVASEVRTLAQRSSTAAKEIRELIARSVSTVQQGTELADEVGQAASAGRQAVRSVAQVIGEIAVASEEQSSGIEQVNKAVIQMDQVTQQNAALVVEASAAAESLEQQAVTLRALIATFTLQKSEVLA
ncbi:methyl-accepting chemotaxis protein [Paramixta manurensis]|uniref:Methyl-accepting chemotaxis protein n=1 Tax=Paramixta manurensis TaxID=2740817 RepID=A0A6M8U9G2_9GAMM|nr:methyl-accepting chemotaxis protein [Erwiniaceae bacterium PD-1]